MDDTGSFETHPVKAVIMAVVYLVVFGVMPFILISILTSTFGDIAFLFNNTGMMALLLSIPLAILAGVAGYFDKGEIYRMIPGIVLSVFTMIYFVVVIGTLDLGWEGDDYTYALTMPGIILLIVLVLLVKAGYFPLEYYVFQKKRDDLQRQNTRPPENEVPVY
ncbi:MAG: hypothetical protein ACQESD_06340 [Thermoplasmatota archaeon]